LKNSRSIIFDLLRGHHIFKGESFTELKHYQDFYSQLFELMDLELVCHQREFFYLANNESNIGKTATSIALIFFVLMRTISVIENDPRPNLFRSTGFDESLLRLDNLSTNDRAILEENGVSSWEMMEKKLGSMSRLGFISRNIKEGRFVFNPPAHRLIELCESFLIDEDNGLDGEEE
jgi:hypothetical protein